jgi:c(7)-type cytochrome triheme protein
MAFLRKCSVVLVAVLFFSITASAWDVPPPHRYGRVVLSNRSGKAAFAAVVFDHWLHRAMFTCRLCHVDIGFAMEAGSTGVTSANIMSGFYCGACHDGKRRHGGRSIFAACSEKFTDDDRKRCARCHSVGQTVEREHEFGRFTEKLPKSAFGLIDWEAAEERGLINPVDFLDGISMKRPALRPQEDFSIEAKSTWMSNVIFSHKKHAVWNGCEVCHPDIFPSVKKGTVKYSMIDIAGGQYCGACHDKVAFPLAECGRCHRKPVQ